MSYTARPCTTVQLSDTGPDTGCLPAWNIYSEDGARRAVLIADDELLQRVLKALNARKP
jgi:hypothetical protein